MFRFVRGLLGLSATLLLAALCGASAGFAQTGTTSLRGTILDSSGAAVAGATVTLSNSQQGIERTVVTEETGTYEFLGLAPGIYSLRVEKENFRKHEINNIELQVNTPKSEYVTLDIGSSLQTVEVAASTQVLNTTDASLGTAFNESQIKQ
ncbi:MAG TPA: carboxypeptidase-like regulatory domain-containing protein, partial [Candidatus Acidoferrum sp.]|nr:carboxypeptidase-like regulatory domain-containing protein [Candidatus Acidoferrum sp.]